MIALVRSYGPHLVSIVRWRVGYNGEQLNAVGDLEHMVINLK